MPIGPFQIFWMPKTKVHRRREDQLSATVDVLKERSVEPKEEKRE